MVISDRALGLREGGLLHPVAQHFIETLVDKRDSIKLLDE